MSSGSSGAGAFRLRDRTVYPDLNRIAGPGGTTQVEPKIMQVLVCLAEHQGDVVTKQDLIARVWEGVFVTDDVLVRAVAELRKIFEDTAERPRVIETIRKRGYRLLVAVQAAGSAGVGAEADSGRTVAVPESDAARPMAAQRPRVVPLIFAALVLVIAGLLRAARAPVPAAPDAMRPVRFLALTTTTDSNEVDPSLSPDGTHLAFASDGSARENTDVFVEQLVDAAPHRITTAPTIDRAPVWSPDGRQIAFVRLGAGTCDIELMPALGGPERRLAPCGNPASFRMSWSPDGRWLAVSAGRVPVATPWQIVLVAVDGSGRRVVTTPPAGTLGDELPAFSPDGRDIAFVRNTSGGVADLYVVPTEGGMPERLTHDNSGLEGVAWSPDGRSLFFSSARAGGYSLWRIARTGGVPRFVAGGGSKIKHPAAARVGGLLAYENWRYEINIWRVPLETAETATPAPPAALIVAADQWNFEPAWSPDGSRIAFVSTRSGAHEIWLADRDGGHLQQLTAFAGAFVASPRWSPDGSRLLFVASPGGRSDLYVADVATRRTHVVATDDSGKVAPSWSRDGRWIYFGSPRRGDWQIWKVPAAGGRPVQVTRDGGYAAVESMDGTVLYFSRIDVPGIWQVPVAGGTPELIVRRLRPADAGNWGVTSAGLFFEVRPDADTDEIWLLPATEDGPRRIATLAGQAWSGLTSPPTAAACSTPAPTTTSATSWGSSWHRQRRQRQGEGSISVT